MRRHALTVLLALIAGFAGAALWSLTGLGDRQTRSYLVANPDILPEMASALQRQDAQRRLAGIEDQVTAAFPGAVLGNPQGTRTLVEFSDYACGYCKASLPHVKALLAADPELKVVIREWPIFPGSEDAARMSLAAAKQGKFAAFHDAMYAHGPPSPDTVRRAAEVAGLDLAQAQVTARSEEVTRELAQNMAWAEQLGFTGTPSWIAGGEIIQGAVGPDRLRGALNGTGGR